MQEPGVAGPVELGPGTALAPPLSVVSPVLSTKPGTDRILRWKLPACSGTPQTVS